jgi:hypothetical protein
MRGVEVFFRTGRNVLAPGSRERTSFWADFEDLQRKSDLQKGDSTGGNDAFGEKNDKSFEGKTVLILNVL